MLTLFLTVVLVGVIMAAMAVGVIFQNKPIQGSCGGLNLIGLDGECEVCGGDLSKCETKEAPGQGTVGSDTGAEPLAYDATRKPGNS